jgi:hypothetical protein
MADTELETKLAIPPVGWVGFAVVVGSLPFLLPFNSRLDQFVHWGLWLLAGLGILYLVVTFRRVYKEYGLAAAMKWVLRGTPPRK